MKFRGRVLIQNQKPSKVIYNGTEYKSLNEFAVKNKFYDKRKRVLLLKFIWRNFKDIKKDDIYNIDLSDEYLKAKLYTYLKGRNCKKPIAIQVIYKNKLYPSIFAFSNEICLCKPEILRTINKDKKYKKGIKLIKLSNKTEKLIDEKIKLKLEKKRKDSTKVIYSNQYKDYTFKSVNELARKIKINCATVKSFMYKKKVKPENYEIDLNKKKYSIFRKYIEKKDINKILVPFKSKVREFAKEKGILLNKVENFIKFKNIKTIKELKKYYTYFY